MRVGLFYITIQELDLFFFPERYGQINGQHGFSGSALTAGYTNYHLSSPLFRKRTRYVGNKNLEAEDLFQERGGQQRI